MKSSATNQFTGGLVMDLNPIVTPNNVLTDALNATITTNNGNEGILQNDMGNGRVETAFLPDGYIPVGSCEFGDIIYIASYNPLINKCLLGCFPSPQRNISSTSVSDLQLSLKASDFQELDSKGNATGKLIANSVRKIVYKNNLTSGDKYIIVSPGIDGEKYITDIDNTNHVKDDFPKLLKIKLISIEEDGKITELSNGLKWYTKEQKDFFIQALKIKEDENGKKDIDLWRTAVSSAYSIFSSKVSGKLAILAELETITGFSCTWGVSTEKYRAKITRNNITGEMIITESNDSDANYSALKYNLYLLCNWETENNNINPSGIVLTKGNWKNSNPKIDLYKFDRKKLKLDISTKVSAPKIRLFPYPIDSELDRTGLMPAYWTSSFNNKYDLINDELEELSYDEFKKLYEYNTYLKNFLKPFLEDPNLNEQNLRLISIGDLYYFNIDFIKKDETGDIHCYRYDEKDPIKPIENLTDDIINNRFKKPIKKEFFNIDLPIEQSISETIGNKSITKKQELDLSNLVYEYEIAPYMPYGILEQFAQKGVIDFSKIGKKIINVNTWKYYNLNGYCTLTWGLEAYTEPNKIISEVIFEFYDNQGISAALHIPDKQSYNGVFTNYITFGVKDPNLNNIDSNGNQFNHRGLDINEAALVPGKTYYICDKTANKIVSDTLIVSADLEYIKLNEENKEDLKNLLGNKYDETHEYVYSESDAGYIYANILYYVKIIIKYAEIGPLETYIPVENGDVTDYRWLWTTKQFNEQYYQELDFKNLQFSLTLDPEMALSSKDNWEVKPTSSKIVLDSDLNNANTLSATLFVKQVVDSEKKPNLNMLISSGFQENYDVFAIKEPTADFNENGEYKYNEDGAKALEISIYLGEESVDNSPSLPEVKFSNSTTTIPKGIYPINVIGGDHNTDKDLLGNYGIPFVLIDTQTTPWNKLEQQNNKMRIAPYSGEGGLTNSQLTPGSGWFPSGSGSLPPIPDDPTNPDTRLNIKIAFGSTPKDIKISNESLTLSTYDKNYVLYTYEFDITEDTKYFLFYSEKGSYDDNGENVNAVTWYYPKKDKTISLENGYDCTEILTSNKKPSNEDDVFSIKNTAEGIHVTINFTIAECGVRYALSSNNDDYFAYRNRFNLGFTADRNYDEGTDDIEYYDSDLNLKTKSGAPCHTSDLWTAYKTGVDLIFFAEHYSKYYYTTSITTTDAKILRTFISSDHDYSTYCLNKDYEVFDKCVAMFLCDRPGRDIRAYFSIIDMHYRNNNTSGLNLNMPAGINFEDNYDHYADAENKSIHEVWKNCRDSVMSNFTGNLFPIIWSHVQDYGDDHKPALYDGKDDYRLTPSDYGNKFEKIQDDYRTYIGTCGCFDLNGNLSIQDLVKENLYVYDKDGNNKITHDVVGINDASPVRFGRQFASILKNCFYVAGTELTPTVGVNNYIYLVENYSQYKRDIIIEIHSNNEDSDNNCISINGWSYEQYLKEMFERTPDLTDVLKQDPNINLKLKACLKTFPFIILMKYIEPDMSYDSNLGIKVEALPEIKSKIEENINTINFERDVIYCLASTLDNKDNKFITELNEGAIFEYYLNNTLKKLFYLDQDFIDNLLVKKNKLEIDRTMPYGSTYYMKFHGDKKYLTEFPKNKMFFHLLS